MGFSNEGDSYNNSYTNSADSITTSGSSSSSSSSSSIIASNDYTDLTPEMRIEQIVLEMLLSHTHEEIPYIANIVTKAITPLGSSNTRMKVRTVRL